MNILVLSDITAGGEWIASQTLIEKLKKKDNSLKFFLISATKSPHLLKKSLFEEVICLQSKSYKTPFKRYRKFLNMVASGVGAINQIYKRYQIDRVVATNYVLALSFLVSQKKNSFTFFFHGIRNNYKIFSETLDHYLIFQKLLEIFIWQISKEFILPSIYAKDVLIEHSLSILKNKGFIVFPNLIRDEFKKNLKNIEDKKIILYSGRLAYDKGVGNLIEAFLPISIKNPKLVIMIVYPGEPEIKFAKKIKTIVGESQNIIFINNPTTEKLSFLYKKAALAILPSPFEISSLFLREALISNLPIISTKTGDAEKILTEPFLLKDNKINTIQNKINDFFGNITKYQKTFSTIAGRFQFQYEEEKIIDDWLNFLRNI